MPSVVWIFCIPKRAGSYNPILFADPGKNLHADPVPDPRGIRGVREKMIFFTFFHVSDVSEQL